MQAYRKAVVACMQMTTLVNGPAPISICALRSACSKFSSPGSLVGQHRAVHRVTKLERNTSQFFTPFSVQGLERQWSFLVGRKLQTRTRSVQSWARQLSTFKGPQEAGIVMASVSAANFKEVYEKDIANAIEQADFIAFDFEFTGVESAPFRRPVELDTGETRYLKFRHSASNFALVQLGLCTMKWDASKGCFIANPYNFHVYPRTTIPGIRDMPSRNFVSQVASLDFLASHNIDFNAWIRTGISYISEENEVRARAHLGLTSDADPQQVLQDDQTEIPLTTTGSLVFHERFVRTLGEWRDSVLRDIQTNKIAPDGTLHNHHGETSQSGAEKSQLLSSLEEVLVPAATVRPDEDETLDPGTGVSVSLEGGAAKPDASRSGTGIVATRPNFLLPKMITREERIARQAARKRFADILLVPEGEGEKRRLRVVYCPKEERSRFVKELHTERQWRVEAQVVEARGLRLIIDALAKSGKPLVGHNCFLDLVHIYEKFFGALPLAANQFVAKTRERFPCILDTKYLVRAEPQLRSKLSSSSSQLAALYDNALKVKLPAGEKFKVEFAEELTRYQENSCKHEAGFDAYMTAVVFAQACNILEVAPEHLKDLMQAAAQAAGKVQAHLPELPAGEQGGVQGTSHDRLAEPDGPPRVVDPAIQRLAQRANALTMGRKGAKEMAFDLLTARETQGARHLPSPKEKSMRRDDRQNVVLAWNIPRDVNVEKLRKEAQILLGPVRSPLPFVAFLDEGAALLEFGDQRMVERILDVLDPSGTAGDERSAATRLVQGGTRAARFGAFHKLCSSIAIFPSATEGAQVLGLGSSEDARPRKRADGSAQGANASHTDKSQEARRGVGATTWTRKPMVEQDNTHEASDGHERDGSYATAQKRIQSPARAEGRQIRQRHGASPPGIQPGSPQDRGPRRAAEGRFGEQRRGPSRPDKDFWQLQKALEAELAASEGAEDGSGEMENKVGAELASDDESGEGPEEMPFGEGPSGEGSSRGEQAGGDGEAESGIGVEQLRERMRQRLQRSSDSFSVGEGDSGPGVLGGGEDRQEGEADMGPGRPLEGSSGRPGADRGDGGTWQWNRHIRFGDDGESGDRRGAGGKLAGAAVGADVGARKRLRTDH